MSAHPSRSRSFVAGRHSELLLQYLTAPYLRIPLVMAFFADQMRVTALGAPELQRVLDAVLFEPGMWQHEHVKEPTSLIPPPKGRAHLATPCGLLFNELAQAPMTLLQARLLQLPAPFASQLRP